MTAAADTILIVDDEEPVRKTFREWLDEADLGCQILSAADAESALVLANRQSIDLAILDWNLGAGNDGLHLLEDLYLFHPNVVAILVTGYAHQATPLDAMRMGVRDYLDKNQDLDRQSFLKAVRRQLEVLRPAKRERQLHQSLKAFREAVEKVLPLVQAAAALNDPVPLTEAVRSLLAFLLRTTGACDGVLLARSYDDRRQPAEICRVYDAAGNAMDVALVPFARSVAGTAVSLQQPCAMDLAQDTGQVELQPFERGRRFLLAAPMEVTPGTHVVIELFDKQAKGDGPAAFTDQDHGMIGAAADFGTEMLRQALAERQTQRILFEAVAAALKAGDSMAASLGGPAAAAPPAVLEQLRDSLQTHAGAVVAAEDTVRLAEAVRLLALRHGPAAVQHCIRSIDNLRQLLDQVTGP